LQAYTFSGGAANISSRSGVTYPGNLIYTFDTDNPDSALFRIRSILTTDIFDPKQNDTIIYYQKFGNYYAFDDGSAEAGYGVNGLGSTNAMIAYRYTLQAPDTLRAIRICFNETYQNSNSKTFDLMVWNDNAGIPGDIMHTEAGVAMKLGTGINGFYTYILTDPVLVNGAFYIGWKQLSETYMNIGFDFNTPHAGKQLYWINGNWSESQAKGSIMIRPVFGPRENITGIEDINASPHRIRFWPNPATDFITIENTENAAFGTRSYSITDLQGRELIRTNNNERIDISSLSPGIYIVIGYNGNRPAAFGRLIKPR